MAKPLKQSLSSEAEVESASRRLDVELQSRRSLELRLEQSQEAALDGETALERQATAVVKLQELAQGLRMELLEEEMVVKKGLGVIGGLEMDLETEKKGSELAQEGRIGPEFHGFAWNLHGFRMISMCFLLPEAFGRAQDAMNALELRTRSASTLQVEASELAALRSEHLAQQRQLAQATEELKLAREQRGAALKASERAQMACVRQQRQAVAMRKRSELCERARSESISEMIEESGVMVRRQQVGASKGPGKRCCKRYNIYILYYILSYLILYYIILYYIILSYLILYYIILYYIILCYIIILYDII